MQVLDYTTIQGPRCDLSITALDDGALILTLTSAGLTVMAILDPDTADALARALVRSSGIAQEVLNG